MDWQAAVAASPVGIAVRVDGIGSLETTWKRTADGSAYYWRDCRWFEARPAQVEGYDDWRPQPRANG